MQDFYQAVSAPVFLALATTSTDQEALELLPRLAWSRQGHGLSKGLDNTSFGQVFIEGDKMTVEANTKARGRCSSWKSKSVWDIRPLTR